MSEELEKRKKYLKSKKDIIFICLMFILIIVCCLVAYYLMGLPTDPCGLCMQQTDMTCFVKNPYGL